MAGTADLWAAVDALVDRAPRVSDLRHHKLHLLAAKRWRDQGRPVPADLAAERQLAAALALAVPPLLQRARAACEGPLVLMKGPEVAARYADPSTRPFRDVDLLAADAAGAHRALLAAGFRVAGEAELYVGIHHLRPLYWPGLPLVVEVHERPKWVAGLRRPPVAEMLEAAVPSATGVDGVLALAPAHHVLAVAAHSWAHVPLGVLMHLVDAAALLDEAGEAEVDALARAWGLQRLWRSTRAGMDWALGGRAPRSPMRLWAAALGAARERTVLESHLARSLAAYWVLPPASALAASARAAVDAVRPEHGEPARAKAARARAAARHASDRLSEHHVALGRATEK